MATDICAAIKNKLLKVPRTRLSREDIACRCNLQVPDRFEKNMWTFHSSTRRPSASTSMTLGWPKTTSTRYTWKTKTQSIENNSKFWKPITNLSSKPRLKLGVVQRSDLLYNYPICFVPKKQRHGLWIVQDFRELNQNFHIDIYSMKEITECIGDICQGNSRIFSTLDLTSGFWQMKLDEQSQPLKAFTIPGKGQFHWITSLMGLLGCPASFPRLMEGVLQNLQNVIVYIDNLLVHSDTHEKHLQVLEEVLDHLQQNHLKIHLEKCNFGNKEVSYLGFTLTPEGIKPIKNKLKLFSKQKCPTMSKPSDPLSVCAISSWRTSRNSPSLLPPINWHGRILDTKEAHYLHLQWALSLTYTNNWCPNL